MCNLGNIYRPPNSRVEFWDKFQEMLDNVKMDTIKQIVIMGDFNAHEHTASGVKLDILNGINHLTSHINEPTRITETTQTNLDKIITNIPHFVTNAEVIPPLLDNDHCTVAISLKFKIKRAQAYRRIMYDYSHADFDGLRTHISQLDWDNILHLHNGDVNEAAQAWTRTIMDTVKQYIPNKTVMIRPNDKTWYNHDLRKFKRKLDRCHKLAKRMSDVNSWAEFRRLRNEYIQNCRDAEKKYESSRLDKLNNSSFTTKECWSLYKSVLGLNTDNTYPSLIYNDRVIDNDTAKAMAFNGIFVEHSTVDDSHKQLPELSEADIGKTTISDIDITVADVTGQLLCLDILKAYGPDGLGPRILKELNPVIAVPLSKLFQACISHGKMPDIWKQANVIPIFKKGDRSDPNNYRPVSLLNTTGTIFEKIIYKYLFNFFRDKFVISLWQSGFMPGNSTICQLLEIYHKFCTAVADGKEVRVVFLDIKRAFDKVWHSGLIFKLRKAGIDGTILNWLKNYLKDRQQRVCINGQYSTWGDILAGVPQGSILGPLLFLIFINDITKTTRHTEIRLFADDTCIFVTVNQRNQDSALVNEDLLAIQKWADD